MPPDVARGLPEAERKTEARQRMAASARRPFDLTSAPLLRAELLRDCYAPLSEAVPILVLRPGAQLDRRVFGDLMGPRPGPRAVAQGGTLRRFQQAEDESV